MDDRRNHSLNNLCHSRKLEPAKIAVKEKWFTNSSDCISSRDSGIGGQKEKIHRDLEYSPRIEITILQDRETSRLLNTYKDLF